MQLYEQWAYVAACLASLVFILGYTFLEMPTRFRMRLRFARWWHHPLGKWQVIFDAFLALLLIPFSVYILFHVDILRLTENSSESRWYYDTTLTAMVLSIVARTIAVMREKSIVRREEIPSDKLEE